MIKYLESFIVRDVFSLLLLWGDQYKFQKFIFHMPNKRCNRHQTDILYACENLYHSNLFRNLNDGGQLNAGRFRGGQPL